MVRMVRSLADRTFQLWEEPLEQRRRPARAGPALEDHRRPDRRKVREEEQHLYVGTNILTKLGLTPS